ncbi:hypothetical protein Efla_007023 [Eimeria flavescens]
MLSTVYSGTSFVLKAGGWQMREIDSIRLWATIDYPSPGTVGLRQGLYDADRGQNNLHSSISIDWHYEARPRLYSTVADDDSMWEREAVQALQLGPREEPSTFDCPNTNRSKRGRDDDRRFACLALCVNANSGDSPPNSSNFSSSFASPSQIFGMQDRPLATTNLTKLVVTLKEGVQPYCQPPRTEPPYKRERISAAVRKGLEAGIHDLSASPWGAPVVLVSRPGNEADDRLCADLRELGNRSVVPRYPLPRTQQALHALQGKA